MIVFSPTKGVPKGFENAATICAEKVIRHVGVKIEIISVIQKISEQKLYCIYIYIVCLV